MGNNAGFWTWPVDKAATRSGSDRLAIVSSVLYAAGALLLLGQVLLGWSSGLVIVGAALVLAGVAGSVGVVGRVLVVRSRIAGH